MEACADLKQRADAAAGADLAGCRGCDPGEKLQKGALAGSVAADDADDVALFNLEVDVLEGPDVVAAALDAAVVGFSDAEVRVFLAADVDCPPAVQVVAERPCAHQSQPVLLADIFKFYCCCHIRITSVLAMHEKHGL